MNARDREDYFRQEQDRLREFVNSLKTKPISNLPLSELVKPKGYAATIAQQLKITRVQLRKVYSELKYICDRVKEEGSLQEETKTKLYMLYPILEYQKNRKVVNERFTELMFALIDNLDRYSTKENFEQADRFLTALVAYTKKES